MSVVGTVAEIWRYPVSSLAGEPLPVAEISGSGIRGDRQFGLVDAETGDIAAPDQHHRWRPAARIAARWSLEGELEIAVPGGGWWPALSRDASRAMTAHMGFSVEIRQLGSIANERWPPHPPLAVPRYERSAIHLVTSASLAELQRRLPRSLIDVRRFRPNVVVRTTEASRFPEYRWVGRALKMGSVLLQIFEPCQRCGFTAIEQDSLPYDPEILRTLVGDNAGSFGVLCAVTNVGVVATGDAAEIV
jgi:hypothetical protein